MFIIITLALIAHLSDTVSDMWFAAASLMEDYDTFFSSDMLDYDRDNLRWNRFLGIKGCLTKLQDHASSKAAFHNQKGGKPHVHLCSH